MLKKEDLERPAVPKNQLHSLKPCLAKFVPPPKTLTDALLVLAALQHKQHMTRQLLFKQQAEHPSPQTEIQLHHLQKRISQITHINTTILTHLTLHKKTSGIARYHNASTPHTANVLRVKYDEHEFLVNLPSSQIKKHFAHCPNLGPVTYDLPHPQHDCDLHPNEALYICEQYHKDILLYIRLAKEKNLQIQIHNAVLKKLKYRLQEGSLLLLDSPPPAPEVRMIKMVSKDRDRHQGEFKMRKKILHVA